MSTLETGNLPVPVITGTVVPTASDHAAVALPETRAPGDPVQAYMDHLDSEQSKATMLACLERLAKIIEDQRLLPHSPTLPVTQSDEKRGARGTAWWRLRPEDTLRIRSITGSELDWSPAYANKHLAALRGVLRQCWRLRLMTREDYELAADLGNIRGSRARGTRAIHPDEVAGLLASATTPTRVVTPHQTAALLWRILTAAGPLPRAEAHRAVLEALDQPCTPLWIDKCYFFLKRTGSARPGPKYGTWAATTKEPPGLTAEMNHAIHTRDAALFVMMQSTGCRRGELAGMRIEDYNRREREMRVTGKGNKERLVWVHFLAVPYVDKWLALVEERTGPFFRPVDQWGHIGAGHLPTNAINAALERHRLRAGLPPMHPHDFRATFIGECFDQGGDSQKVMRLNGHKESKTTDWYDPRGNRGLRDLVDRLNIVLPVAEATTEGTP